MTTAYWAGLTVPEATQQDTETRVFVGGPLDQIALQSFQEGNPSTTTASTTLSYPVGAYPEADQTMYVVNAAAFLAKGAVCVDGTDWFTYDSVTTSTTPDQLNGLRRLGRGSGTKLAIGKAVAQWRDMTTDITSITEAGGATGAGGTWSLRIEGVNWSNVWLGQDMSCLVQERQWDDLSAAWSDWRDTFLGYFGEPEPKTDHTGLITWSVTATGRWRYLRSMQASAGQYGLRSIKPSSATASTTLANASLADGEGQAQGDDFSVSHVYDGNARSVWISSVIPSAAELVKDQPWYSRKDVPPKIVTVGCNLKGTARWSRKDLCFVEVFNPRDPDADPANPKSHQMDYGSWVLESSNGIRVYVGSIRGWWGGRMLDGFKSIVFAANAVAFRATFNVSDDTVVVDLRECDGWNASGGLAAGQYQNVGNLFRGFGNFFDLNPAGDWVALRTHSGEFGGTGAPADYEPGGTARFVERWLDFVSWGDAAKFGMWDQYAWCRGSGFTMYGTAGQHPATYLIRRVAQDGTETIPDQNNDGHPYPDLPGSGVAALTNTVWGFFDETVAPASGTGWSNSPQTAVTCPVDPATGVAGLPLNSCLRRSAVGAVRGLGARMGGGIARVLQGTTPVYSHFDSNSPLDWKIEALPQIGSVANLVNDQSITFVMPTFPAAAIATSGDHGTYITVNDASFYPIGSTSKPIRVITNQLDANGVAISFEYTGTTATTFEGVQNRSAADTLTSGTTITLRIPTNIDGENWIENKNLYNFRMVGMRRWSPTGVTSVIKRWTLRSTRRASPTDPATFLGNSIDWFQNWVASYPNANRWVNMHIAWPDGYNWAEQFFLTINEMSDGGLAKLNEITFWIDPHPDFQSWDGMDSQTDLPYYYPSTVADAILKRAGVPARQRFCIGTGLAAIRSITVGTGSVVDALESLCKKTGMVWYEDRLGVYNVRIDPRHPYAIPGAPVLTITNDVARGQVKIRQRPKHQVSQVQLLARTDLDDEVIEVWYPGGALPVGQPLAVNDRYVAVEGDATALAQLEFRKANLGWVLDVNVGSFDECELWDLVRVEGVYLDVDKQVIISDDFLVTGSNAKVTHEGKSVTLRLEQRQVL